jgi:hypothetical protein
MTPSRPTRKTPVNLSESISRQLNLYALSAGAAGVGMLALAQPAEAKIVYTRVHMQIPYRTGFHLDLNHDRINDFSFLNYDGNTDDMVSLGVGPVYAGNGIRSRAGYAAALRGGASIGRKGKFFEQKYFELMADVNFSHDTCRGPWGNGKSRYLGLKFIIKGKTHFGWARLNVTCDGGNQTIKAVLTGYAYETIPNKSIVAGKTKGPDVITVHPDSTPATLGRLALGRRQERH